MNAVEEITRLTDLIFIHKKALLTVLEKIGDGEAVDPAIAIALQSDTNGLLQALSALVRGKTIPQAFGAPGAWGYGMSFGDALQSLYSAMATMKAENEKDHKAEAWARRVEGENYDSN
ncbi:MAG: hypothetical protein LUC93_05555 [Planctomycetaceae bacterium]|nr:hypothetical protein [Planctomycetaceae bacterium]